MAAFSKRHYEALGKLLRKTRSVAASQPNGTLAWCIVQQAMGDALSEDNPAFELQAFNDACWADD